MGYGEYGIPLEMPTDQPSTGPANAPLWRSTNFGLLGPWTADSAFRSPCDLIVVPDGSESSGRRQHRNSTNPPAQVPKSTNAGLTFQLMYSGPGGQDVGNAGDGLQSTEQGRRHRHAVGRGGGAQHQLWRDLDAGAAPQAWGSTSRDVPTSCSASTRGRRSS
jgi:hypothetical protein